MNKEPIQMTPGNDLHLTLLMAPQSLNFVTGQDREHLLAFGRAAFEAGQSSKCLLQIAEPSAQTPEDAQIQALMRKHRIWIEHSTLFENDEPERELRAVQAEEHQFNAFVQDLIAATQLAAAPQAVPAAVAVPDELVRVVDLKSVGDRFYRGNWVSEEGVSELIDAALAATPPAANPADGFPDGWVPCVITYEGQHPEEVAYGPQVMMDRLKKWLDRYFEMRAAPAHPAEGVPSHAVAGNDLIRAAKQALACMDGLQQHLGRAVCQIEADELRTALAATQPTEAARSVLAERARQIAAEGWTPEKDDAYNPGVLAEAGGIYALHAFDPRRVKETPEGWPWSPGWWKPKDPRTNLVKAGALVLAEIERIDRTYAAQAKQGGA